MYDWLSYEMLSYLSSFGANEGKAYVSEEMDGLMECSIDRKFEP
jgi:hypothetical protein